MPRRVVPSLDEVRDLEILLKAHHPLIAVDTVEEDRAGSLFDYVADRLEIGVYTWNAHEGLVSHLIDGAIPKTEDPTECLQYLLNHGKEAVYHLPEFAPFLESAKNRALVKQLYRSFFEHQGAVIITGADTELPADLEPLFTGVQLNAPNSRAYYQFVTGVLRDLKKRMPVQVTLTSEDVAVLLNHLQGLTFFEVKKIVTQSVIEDGIFSREDLSKILDAKKRVVQRSGVLDYYPAEESLDDIAGLSELKAWLKKRKQAFRDPRRAKEFGLSAPRALLLLGVQGCGKSLCAKAVASEWELPLIRMDPSNLYNKFYGESEKNLRRAIKTAESLAPIVLWIDEIEKAFGGTEGQDSGPSTRIFGTFLTWLNDKKDSVFVIATANDISKLPPELMRKGRFDEIFFVDLPQQSVREQIFSLHLRRRSRDPALFKLPELAVASEGFSGAEIEQAVISALYTAFSREQDLDQEILLSEIRATRPLSVTMSESIDELRSWAKDRAVMADTAD